MPDEMYKADKRALIPVVRAFLYDGVGVIKGLSVWGLDSRSVEFWLL